MKKLTVSLLCCFVFVGLLLFLSISVMAQDETIDCNSPDISDEDYNAYCADEDYIDCESPDISDEDYNAYCADDSNSTDEDYVDCESPDISDEDYDYYCSDAYYTDDGSLDCESPDISDEEYNTYCAFDYNDYTDDYGDFVASDEFGNDFVGNGENQQGDVGNTFVVEDASLAGTPLDDEQALWNAYISIIPAEWVQTISSFEITNDPETSGYVYVDDNDPTKFVLGLNPVELSEPDELTHTVVHEFAHVLTLNSGQVRGVAGTCSTLALDEGCAGASSYINQFNKQFWVTKADGFVSDYASTDITEDMAESFAAFVLQDKPSGTSVAEQKINFYYNFPEAVQLRQQIRANIANQ